MEYIPVLIMMAVGVLVGGIVLLLSSILGPKSPSIMKDTPFECGVPPVGDAQHRISVRFYLVAILFLLFDVEGVFFFPWAVVYRKYLTYGPYILWEMGLFMGLLLLGYFYVVRKKALEWE